jgi:hypothetical protein
MATLKSAVLFSLPNAVATVDGVIESALTLVMNAATARAAEAEFRWLIFMV